MSESNLQTDQPDEEIELVEGDEAPPEPDVLNPRKSEDIPVDEENSGMDDLPEESLKADPDDKKGLGGACG